MRRRDVAARSAGGQAARRIGLDGWWAKRSLRARLTWASGLGFLAILIGLAVLLGNAVEPLLIRSVDAELRTALAAASGEVSAGRLPDSPAAVTIRVLDTAGTPLDGRPAAALGSTEIRALKAGDPVSISSEVAGDNLRWLGNVVIAPDGSPRLVVAGAGLVGFTAAVQSASSWLLWFAVLAAVVAAVLTWLLVRAALRPVVRMRRTLRSLPPGERLPLPSSRDEIRELAAEFNTLLARQEEVSQRLRRFTGDAAHELRSPVASIRVQAEVAVANPDPELTQETLADILAEAERLSSLLDGLLTLARSDAGEVLPAEPVELVTEVRAAINRLPAGSPSVRVSGVVGDVWAYAAPAEVELVLNNLLRNACRYAETQIVISVLAARATVRVVIDDDGPGIPVEHRAKVFDRFYRIADDRARTSGGTGLGLAMVAEAVRRRGGQVTVGESPEGGARFHVTWPATDPDGS